MSSKTSWIGSVLAGLGITQYVPVRRVRQLASFAFVGATGIPIDLAVTTAAIPAVGVLAAQAAGWVVAATWNHAWNRRLTWDASRHPLRTWVRYLVVDSGRLAVRVVVVAVLTTLEGVGALPATLAGVAVAMLLGFIGFDRVVFRD